MRTIFLVLLVILVIYKFYFATEHFNTDLTPHKEFYDYGINYWTGYFTDGSKIYRIRTSSNLGSSISDNSVNPYSVNIWNNVTKSWNQVYYDGKILQMLFVSKMSFGKQITYYVLSNSGSKIFQDNLKFDKTKTPFTLSNGTYTLTSTTKPT